MSIGERIILLREHYGWTQKELADKSNINVSVMNRIEANERRLRDCEIIFLSKVFNVSSDYLLGIEESESKITMLQHVELSKLSKSELDKLWKVWSIMNKSDI